MVAREAIARKKSPHTPVVDDNGNKNALFLAGRTPPTMVVVSEGAKSTKRDRREPTFARPSRREQGRLPLEQRDSRISRHEVLESFREETRSQRGLSSNRSTRHHQRSQSIDLSGMHLLEHHTHQRPKEIQGPLIAPQGREDSDVLFPDPRAKLKPAPDHSVHAKIRRIQGPNGGMWRRTPKESVTLEDTSVLGCSRRIDEKSHKAADVATRDPESVSEGGTELSNFWSRLRCQSHAHEETSPTSYEDGLEAADVFLSPPDQPQSAQSPSKATSGLRSIFVKPSTRKHPNVRGMYPNAANTCDSPTLIEMLERKLRDLKDSSNPEMTAPEVGYLVAALSRLRDDALHLQGAPNTDRCDNDIIISGTTLRTYQTLGDADCVDQVAWKMFGSWDYLEGTAVGLDRLCEPLGLKHKIA